MRTAITIKLDASDRATLKRLKRGRRVSVRLAERAAIVLHAADGLENQEIGALMEISRQKAGRWRARYAERGLEGIEKDAVPVGIPECGVPRPVWMEKSRFFEFESTSGGFLVDCGDIAPAEVDKVLSDVTLVETQSHIVVLKDAPVFGPVIANDGEVELQIELHRSREILDVEAGIVLTEIHSHLPLCSVAV